MKQTKKVLSMLLVLTFCITMFSGFAKSATTKGSSPDTIVYAFLTFNKISENLGPVEDAINAITVPKINVKVKLKPLDIANYANQINLSIQSGEQLDVFHSIGDLSLLISKNEILPLDDLINKYAKETKQAVGSSFLKATQSDGKTYGIPADKGVALAPDLVYRTDIMKAVGVTPSSIKTIGDLDALFAKVKKKYPNMIPVAPVNQGNLGTLMTLSNIDYLNDSYFTPTAVLVGNSLKVQDFYETKEFKNKIKVARDWYNKGYVPKDAATSTTLASELIAADRCFSYIASYSGKEAGAQISAMSGKPMGMVRLAKPYLSTTSVNAISWVISSGCKKPEAAMKFMNLTFTDKKVVNLIIYGLEGQDYVKTDATHIKYPTGKDSNTVPYTAQLSCGIVGNMFIQYQVQGQSAADLKLMDLENKTAARSKAFGFTFDSSKVKTQYSSVTNVINQYLPGLSCGSLDPDKEIPKFIKALKDAGMDAIVAEKQKQLDAWAAKQK